ncbi:serine/threonine-protein kinase [Ahniella affigens]|uniref:serine/threonine-protein kinase n=1 Tax=Ahniella affigens TaxID=2021234 RepID=UPI0014739BE1|nr:serine/threonine-protein kinase [Ahniella affigens]
MALEQPASEREAFVRMHASDPAIATEVLRLMGLDEQPQIHTLQGVQAMADAEAAPLAQGRRVGKFELFEVLGEGGMGQVYRARRVDGPEHWVALKLMRRGLFNAASESRFLAEQQFLARLNHPNIAHYIDSGSDTYGHVYVAMELVQGQRLLDYAKAQQLNAKQRVALFRQLLSAVSYAHRQLIIHRDLKQANVLVTADGVVKLLDFGIAKLLQDQSQMTGTIERLYTPTCAAPEQIRGEPCDVTTDVYALGVLLYELIAGKSIFDTEGKTPGEFENLVLNVPPPDMKSRVHPDLGCTDIPTDLERIVAKAIRKEPNRRYGSVEQLDADLERLLNNEPVSVSGNGFLYRTQKFLSRNKLASGLTALIAIAVLSGLVITLQQNREIRAERDRANLALDAMKQAFLGADPGGEAGGEVTARQILQKSAENLDALIASNDQSFLDLATVLFEVQISMGLFDDAQRTYQRLGEDSYRYHSRICLLSARLLVEQDRSSEAAERLSHCTPATPDEANIELIASARIARYQDRIAEAFKLFQEAQQTLPASHPDWLLSVTNQKVMLLNQRRVAEALNLLGAAIEKAKQELGPNHVTIARLELLEFHALARSGRRADFEARIPEVLQTMRTRFGEISAPVATAENTVGSYFGTLEEHSAAVPHFERAHEIYNAMFGPDHLRTLKIRANLVVWRAFAGAPTQTVRTDFEDLIARTDQPGLEAMPGFVRTEYVRWLTNQGESEQALRVALSIPPSILAQTSSDSKGRRIEFLIQNYWAASCSKDDSGFFGRSEVCKSFPRLDSLCHNARKVICAYPSDPFRRLLSEGLHPDLSTPRRSL